ncbi:hypothetical protein D047_1117B, partial [Vibrio parahaemolyticus VPTS-2010_2]
AKPQTQKRNLGRD